MLRTDAAADLALLAVPGVDGPRLRTTGATNDLRLTRPRGTTTLDGTRRLTATYTPLDGPAVRRPVLRLNATSRPGDSGSPVVDADGRIAGIVFAADDTHPRRAWAVTGPALTRLVR